MNELNEIGMLFGLSVMAAGLVFFAVTTALVMAKGDNKDVKN